MKNANAKGFDKDRKQSSLSQFKNQDRGNKDAKEGGQYTIPSEPKFFGYQGFGHIKQECPTYVKTIGKSKALAVTLSDTELEDDSNNEDDGILNAFNTTVDPADGGSETIDDEEDLVDSKFKKMDDQDDIHTAYRKLYKVSEKYEKLYRILWFENNFLDEKTKKLEAKLFQVRAQLERTSSAKLDEMLNLQKSASDRTGLRYELSSPNIASTSTTVFISPTNNIESDNNNVKTMLASENIDKGKSILEAPPKLDKKETKTPGLRKAILKSINKRSSISTITVEQLYILDQITISGQPLNRVTI